MIKFLTQMFSASTGRISSKRVCGVIGWIVILAVFIQCSITNKQAPEMVDILMFCCVTLLGVDSITGNIYKNKKEQK